MPKYFIYETVAPNKKLYIGFHYGEIDDGYLGSGKLLLRAINKYGKDKFNRKILFICEDEIEASWLESIIVNNYVVNNKTFYNVCMGGLGGSGKSLRLSNDDYLIKLKKVHANKIIPIEKYKGSSVKINHKCDCGNIWKVKPNSLLGGVGCPKCSRKIANSKIGEKLRFSHKEYLYKLEKIHKDRIIPIEIYIKSSIKIKHKCNNCGYIWNTMPIVLLQGSGCPECAKKIVGNKRLFSQTKYDEKLFLKHENNYKRLENYKGFKIKILHICNRCKHKWKVLPGNILNGSGCPNCHDKKRTQRIIANSKSREKAIIGINKEGNIVYYNSITKAAKDLGCGKTNICNCLKGKSKTAKGYKFKYVD